MTRTSLANLNTYLQRPWFAAFLYAVLGIAWITGSDQLLVWLLNDIELLSRYQSYKGYFYVALTAFLAWFILRQRQHYLTELTETEKKLAATFEYAAVGIAHVAESGRFLRANALLCQFLGYTEQQLTMLSFQDVTHPEDLERDKRLVRELLAGTTKQYTLEKRYVRADGIIVWGRLSVALVRSASEQYFISVIQDITQERATQLQLKQSELRFRTLLDNAPQLAIQGYSRDATTFYWNKACEQIYGYTKEEAIGQSLLDLIIPDHMRDVVKAAMQHMADTGQPIPSEELVLKRKDGSQVTVYSGHAVVKLPDMEPQIFCIDLDLTEQKKQAAELAFLADFDVVTELPNRQYFNRRVEQAIANADSTADQCAVLLMDLDNFKDINDSYGHGVGDKLLLEISQRLHRSCAPKYTVARLGGDEFGVLVQSVESLNQLTDLAEQLLVQLKQPVTLADNSVLISSASIGISLYPDHAANHDDLIRAADAAMYKVKHSGRNHIAFYSDELTTQARQRVQLEARLRQALSANTLQCYFQPQLDIQTGELVGAEVLLRWFDEELGAISPAVFVPLAESCGLIHALGHWVLQQSCHQYMQWLIQGGKPFRLAVNVSAQQFSKENLFDELKQVLKKTGMKPEHLELEVTESALMIDEIRVVEVMNKIRALGVSLAIDDFGTGYSSLSYLKKLPLDVLKIDRRFIEHIPQANDDKQIASAIIALAHNLNFKVLAEGVETAEQLAFLQQHGCDYYQGYYFSKPLPADQFWALTQDSFNPIS